ncbi:FeoB small GTPase domain-containing protein [Aphanothece sacrum]|uniref:Ferrous iron transport protein B n=1 Tax=Aphanothece sacrum FPU1 TaxID=1920663 RepID=A0A401ICL6_APHSA|nr:FeoB small GTPase domain-containing protein [Aphanothece sacrum]GBF79038.1 ferrous iron transport protein B [Aphanothece sacrum FPU1]GBF86083.1 ferrous iron transport protein B [Aphanothece sacrum FPU3]
MKCNSCPDSCETKSNKPKQKSRRFWAKQTTKPSPPPSNHPTIILVGSPNVGKSLLFNVLTGSYVSVGNYPGTTVEVSRSHTIIGGQTVTMIDTPGMYSLVSLTEEEKFSRNLLFTEKIDLVIHVIDAKNVSRMLPLTFQLIETQIPIILAVNMIDEAEKLGIWVNEKQLEASLGISVVTLSAIQKRGIQTLTNKVANHVFIPSLSYSY